MLLAYSIHADIKQTQQYIIHHNTQQHLWNGSESIEPLHQQFVMIVCVKDATVVQYH